MRLKCDARKFDDWQIVPNAWDVFSLIGYCDDWVDRLHLNPSANHLAVITTRRLDSIQWADTPEQMEIPWVPKWKYQPGATASQTTRIFHNFPRIRIGHWVNLNAADIGIINVLRQLELPCD